MFFACGVSCQLTPGGHLKMGGPLAGGEHARPVAAKASAPWKWRKLATCRYIPIGGFQGQSSWDRIRSDSLQLICRRQEPRLGLSLEDPRAWSHGLREPHVAAYYAAFSNDAATTENGCPGVD